MMQDYEVEELVEYIKIGMREAKRQDVSEDEFLVKAIESIVSKRLDLDEAIESVRQVAIDMEIVGDEE